MPVSESGSVTSHTGSACMTNQHCYTYPSILLSLHPLLTSPLSSFLHFLPLPLPPTFLPLPHSLVPPSLTPSFVCPTHVQDVSRWGAACSFPDLCHDAASLAKAAATAATRHEAGSARPEWTPAGTNRWSPTLAGSNRERMSRGQQTRILCYLRRVSGVGILAD